MMMAVGTLMATTAAAQGTVDDYKRAEALRGKYSWKMANGDVSVHRRRGEAHKFWYSVYDGKETVYKEVDADQNTVTLLKENPEPPRRREWRGPQRHWMEVPNEKDGFRRSPTDSTLTIFHRNHNLWTKQGGVEKPLTTDGDTTYYYSAWGTFSEDGRYYATVRIKPAPKHYVYYVESMPPVQNPGVGGVQPVLHKQEYAKPGDSLNYRVPVVVDITHSLQQPNQSAGVTGGRPDMIETIGRAAIAVGADGIFMETHPDPARAKSDGANMLRLDLAETLLEHLTAIRKTINKL